MEPSHNLGLPSTQRHLTSTQYRSRNRQTRPGQTAGTLLTPSCDGHTVERVLGEVGSRTGCLALHRSVSQGSATVGECALAYVAREPFARTFTVSATGSPWSFDTSSPRRLSLSLRAEERGLRTEMSDRSRSPQHAWVLTQNAFDNLLVCLDPVRDRAAEKYETLRRKLVKFFQWRGSLAAEDDADEALNRVARRLQEGEQIRDICSYVNGVARLLALESMKHHEQERLALERRPPTSTSENREESARQLECLDSCLERFPAETRVLITEYYQHEKHRKIEQRKALAARLGIPPNALRIRLHRLRATLEQCVADCVKQSAVKQI